MDGFRESPIQISVAFLGPIAGIIALAFWGTEGASNDEIILRVASAIVLGIVLVCIYGWYFVSIPPAIYGGQEEKISFLTEKIDTLELNAKPKVWLSFSSDDEFFLYKDFFPRAGRQPAGKATWVLIGVQNKGRETIRNCRARLSVEKIGGDGTPESIQALRGLHLKWQNHTTTGINLGFGAMEYVSVFYKRENNLHVFLETGRAPNQFFKYFEEPGSYKFVIEVNGDNSPPEKIDFVMDWNEAKRELRVGGRKIP